MKTYKFARTWGALMLAALLMLGVAATTALAHRIDQDQIDADPVIPTPEPPAPPLNNGRN